MWNIYIWNIYILYMAYIYGRYMVYIYIYTIYHILSYFLLHLSVFGSLGQFHSLAIVNRAAINMDMWVSLLYINLYFLDIYPRVV
jgi:hypothetical protein